MQPFGSIVKPEIAEILGNSMAAAPEHPVDIFEAGLEARIAQALAVGDFRQAALAALAHPRALSWPDISYSTIHALAHSTEPLMSCEADALELAALAVLVGVAENSRNAPENPDNSVASVLHGRASP